MTLDVNSADNFYMNGHAVDRIFFQGEEIWPNHVTYRDKYLTIEPLTDSGGTITIRGGWGNDESGRSNKILSYSKDLTHWTTISWPYSTSGDPLIATINVSPNEKVYFRGQFSTKGIETINIKPNYDFEVSGNLSSLWYNDNFNAQMITLGSVNELFKNSTHLIHAYKLIIPAGRIYNYSWVTTSPYGLREYQCASMFYGCTNLLTPPKFYSLNYTPSDATRIDYISHYACQYMFWGCTSLETVPKLPYHTIVNYASFYRMFKNCTSILEAPELPATDIGRVSGYESNPDGERTEKSYAEMFSGCTSLVSAPPILPLTVLGRDTYYKMFSGCTSLTITPVFPESIHIYSRDSYGYMFENCTSLSGNVTIPIDDNAMIYGQDSYENMFTGCTNLNRITCLSAAQRTYTYGGTTYNLYNNWVDGVSQTGTFIKNPNATWVTGVNGIPSGWTVQDA